MNGGGKEVGRRGGEEHGVKGVHEVHGVKGVKGVKEEGRRGGEEERRKGGVAFLYCYLITTHC